MSDIEVKDGMLFESTEAARVQERFTVGQDERHTVPLVRRWLALGTVRPVAVKPLDDSELECMTAALAALRTKPYGSSEHETARRTLELLGPRLAEEVERVRAATAERRWTLDEIRVAWERAQETGRPEWKPARDADDLANSWEHVRGALTGEAV